LANKISWDSLEKEFAPLYGDVIDRPSIPIRTIVDLLLVKQIYNLGDETVMKKYEFGNKSSFAYTRKSGIIVGAMAVNGNMYDGQILKPQLDQVKELTGGRIRKAIVDRGYKVKGGIPGIEIVMPKNPKKESYYLKKKREERCLSRAGIKGLISHLKHDHRMLRNYLSGIAGDKINILLAAAAYNMRKWMRLKQEELLNFVLRWIFQWQFWSLGNIRLSLR
jgi:IS5 family transposase